MRPVRRVTAAARGVALGLALAVGVPGTIFAVLLGIVVTWHARKRMRTVEGEPVLPQNKGLALMDRPQFGNRTEFDTTFPCQQGNDCGLGLGARHPVLCRSISTHSRPGRRITASNFSDPSNT